MLDTSRTLNTNSGLYMFHSLTRCFGCWCLLNSPRTTLSVILSQVANQKREMEWI